jgi:hypothetical protein
MKMKTTCPSLLAFWLLIFWSVVFCLPSEANAQSPQQDHIVIKTGQHYSGRITVLTEDTVVIETIQQGPLAIPRSEVLRLVYVTGNASSRVPTSVRIRLDALRQRIAQEERAAQEETRTGSAPSASISSSTGGFQAGSTASQPEGTLDDIPPFFSSSPRSPAGQWDFPLHGPLNPLDFSQYVEHGRMAPSFAGSSIRNFGVRPGHLAFLSRQDGKSQLNEGLLWKPLGVTRQFKEGDQIKTIDGRLRLQLRDGSAFLVAPETHIVLQEDPNQQGHPIMQLEQGRLWWVGQEEDGGGVATRRRLVHISDHRFDTYATSMGINRSSTGDIQVFQPDGTLRYRPGQANRSEQTFAGPVLLTITASGSITPKYQVDVQSETQRFEIEL